MGMMILSSALYYLVLRLMGVIDWPWWAVLAPLWPIAFLAAVIIVLLLIKMFIRKKER